MRPGARRRAVGVGLALVWTLPSAACRRHHIPLELEAGPELGYPLCGDAGTWTAIAQGHIRSGPFSHEKNVVERFDLRRTECGYVFHSRQEWPLAISDVEVHYDAELTPVWAWKRMTIAGSTRPDGNGDIRRYELRTGEVFIKRRDAAGQTTLEQLLPGGRAPVPPGARVGAVVGPSRGIITPWLKRAKLGVGARSRELVLDFRELSETLKMATLERSQDQFEPSLGRTVRVYTFYGKETVFADEDDVVLGDLAGMRPSSSLTTPEPDPLPMYGDPHPQESP